MNNEEFDRSKCFTFYGSYATQGKRIRKLYGDKMAADYYEAIIDYALNKKPIEDEKLMLLIGDTLLETVNSSQKRRARGFGEDMELTRSIIELVRDRPGISQNDIASELHCSKGKVNQALKNFKEGKYEKEFDFNIILRGVEYRSNGQVVTDKNESEYEEIEETECCGHGTNTNSNTNNNSNTNSTDRYRDRFAGATETGTVGEGLRPDVPLRCTDSRFAPGSADATQSNMIERFNYFKSLDYDATIPSKELPRIVAISYSELDPDIYDTPDSRREKLIKDFTGGYYKAKNKDNIIALIDAVIAGEIVERK